MNGITSLMDLLLYIITHFPQNRAQLRNLIKVWLQLHVKMQVKMK
jgi:hypothetical protein